MTSEELPRQDRSPAHEVSASLLESFAAGQGGRVKFVTKVVMQTSTFYVSICVLFPKSAYGIPVQVAC